MGFFYNIYIYKYLFVVDIYIFYMYVINYFEENKNNYKLFDIII